MNSNDRPHNRRNKFRNRRRPQGRRPLRLDDLIKKRDNLLEQHYTNRKKYFEMYYRVDPQQRQKLERNFYRTIEQLREFEARIPEELKEAYVKWIDHPEVDKTYSNNHQLPFEGAPDPQIAQKTNFEDPHLLVSQKNVSFRDDTEESVGTIDDYLNYKNSVAR